MSAREGLWQYGRTPLTLAFQKEVADRMVAPMLGAQRCRLSLICQCLCDIDLLFTMTSNASSPYLHLALSLIIFNLCFYSKEIYVISSLIIFQFSSHSIGNVSSSGFVAVQAHSTDLDFPERGC